MAIAQALHLEFQNRFERNGANVAFERYEIDLRRRRQARARVITDAMSRRGHALIFRLGRRRHCAFAAEQRRDDALAHQRFAARTVEENRVGHMVFPEQWCPEEERTRHGRRRGTAGLRFTDTAHAPRTILGAIADGFLNADRTFRVFYPTRPAAELIETRRIHAAPCAIPQRLTIFLNGAGAGGEHQLAANAAGVVFQRHAGAQHRLQHLNAKRTHLHFRAFQRRTARAIETVLALPRLHHAEGAIQNAAMGIDRHANAEVVRTVRRIAVEPGAVVDITIAGRGMGQRLGRLVNRIVVKFVEHEWFRKRAEGERQRCNCTELMQREHSAWAGSSTSKGFRRSRGQIALWRALLHVASGAATALRHRS